MGPVLKTAPQDSGAAAVAEQAPALRLSEPFELPALAKVRPPEQLEISAITSKEAHGLQHIVRVGEVDLLPLASNMIGPAKMTDLLSYALLPDARGEHVRRVMIADTLPTDSIRELIERLHRAGVEVHFRDHHHGDYAGSGKNYHFNEERIAECLGRNCWVETREQAPSITNMIQEGELAEGGRSLYICAPADIDALCGGLLAANLNPDRLKKAGMDSTVHALGVVDSKIGHYDGNKPALIDWYNRLRGEIGNDPKKLQTALATLAGAIKERDADFSHAKNTGSLEAAANLRHDAMLAMLRTPFTEFGGRSIRLDLTSTGKAFATFADRSDPLAKAAMELMRPGGFEINSLMSFCGHSGAIGSQRNYKDGLVAIVKMEGPRGAPEYGLLLSGKYRHLDFRAAERDLRMDLHTVIGFKAYCSEANFPKVLAWLKAKMDLLDEGPGAVQQRTQNPERKYIISGDDYARRMRRFG